MVMAMPKIKRKLIILPTPKYLRIVKEVIAKDVIRPLLELAKIVEKVKRRVKKRATKNKGIAPKVSGSTK
jgi:hypothetical protein